MTSVRSNDEIRTSVRHAYAAAVETASDVGGLSASASTSCCPAPGASAPTDGRVLGYGEDELAAVPEGSNLGLGCGNPTALAELAEGETVLDPASV